jgi:DnaJ domain
MKRSRTSPHSTPPPTLRHCEAAGCSAAGEYPAPKKRHGSRNDYHWFCLTHVRDFNKRYNYFEGMDDETVQDFMKDAVTGHRPTWKMGSDQRVTAWDVEEAVRRFFGDPTSPPKQPTLPEPLQKALSAFSLAHPTDASVIKQRYKQLVKAHHPDINRAADAEEMFKNITVHYRMLMDYYA